MPGGETGGRNPGQNPRATTDTPLFCLLFLERSTVHRLSFAVEVLPFHISLRLLFKIIYDLPFVVTFLIEA